MFLWLNLQNTRLRKEKVKYLVTYYEFFSYEE